MIARERCAPAYWEEYAPWYAQWLAHTNYHRPVRAVLARRAAPGWRVLDVGGGSGILSLFLRSIGCRAVLLEPARAMRTLFERARQSAGAAGIDLVGQRWEDFPAGRLSRYDLVLACNSFHLTGLGFRRALAKAFAGGPRNIFIAAEVPCPRAEREPGAVRYRLALSAVLDVPSSFAYHHPDEALAHWAWRRKASPSPRQRKAILDRLVFENSHYWIKDTARLRLRWWTRRDLPSAGSP
jgi:SAM-dependent methyltransferase